MLTPQRAPRFARTIGAVSLALVAFSIFASGCVAPPPAHASPPQSAASPEPRSLAANAATGSPAIPLPFASASVPESAPVVDRTFQLRIIEDGRVIFSSWPNESWELKGERNPEKTTPPRVNVTSNLPLILQPFRGAWLAAPPRSIVEIRNFTLGAAGVQHMNLRRAAYLPITGYIPRESPRFLGDGAEPGRMLLAHRVPLNLTPTSSGDLAYKVEMVEGSRFAVPKTTGLYAVFHDHLNGTGEFRLEAPNGTFQSLGCKPIPGTEIPPGWYVIHSQSPESFAVSRYADRYEPGLANRTVTVQATFLN